METISTETIKDILKDGVYYKCKVCGKYWFYHDPRKGMGYESEHDEQCAFLFMNSCLLWPENPETHKRFIKLLKKMEKKGDLPELSFLLATLDKDVRPKKIGENP